MSSENQKHIKNDKTFILNNIILNNNIRLLSAAYTEKSVKKNKIIPFVYQRITCLIFRIAEAHPISNAIATKHLW